MRYISLFQLLIGFILGWSWAWWRAHRVKAPSYSTPARKKKAHFFSADTLRIRRRYGASGPSVEEARRFYAGQLRPLLNNQTGLGVDLDGVAGYASSVLKEMFYPVGYEFGKPGIRNVTVLCTDEPYLVEECEAYMEEGRLDKLKKLGRTPTKSEESSIDEPLHDPEDYVPGSWKPKETV